MDVRDRTRQIALGGLFAAFIILLEIILRVTPTADLFMNFMVSLAMFAAIAELGGAAAFLVYLAAGILTFVWPGPPDVLGFLICGGPYPFVKNLIEKKTAGRRAGRISSILFKCAAGLVLGFVYYLIMTRFFIAPAVTERLTSLAFFEIWIGPLFLAGFFVYDSLLSQGIDFYHQRIRRYLGRTRDRKTP